MKSTSLLFALTFMLAVSASAQRDTLGFAKPQKLSDKVNSGAEESLPLLSADGKTLYFTRTYHPDNTGGKFAGQDIWASPINNGKNEMSKKLPGLNTKLNDVVVGSARGGQRLYLLNVAGEKRGTVVAGVSRTDYDDAAGKWGEPVGCLVPGLDVKGNFYSAFVGPNEDYILWTLPGNDVDTANSIYVSLSTDKGESWTEPFSTGRTINSEGDDISPYYDDTRGLLFWASNGREGFGDYDIYYARRLDNTWKNWSEPVNAGPEINSPSFDAYFFASADGSAWYSSNKNDSLSNIYMSSVVIIPAEEVQEEEEEVAVEEVAVVQEVVTTTKRPQEKDPVLIIDTKTSSSTTRSLMDLSLEELLDKDTHIRFVYFPYDKYNISAKYIEVLDDVAKILDKYQELDVTIEGHTDNVGSQAYNQVLSENRALSTKEYLMINGAEESRIKTKAFGKLKPYSNNETEEGRALNRRVELFFRKAK